MWEYNRPEKTNGKRDEKVAGFVSVVVRSVLIPKIASQIRTQ